MKKIGIKRRRKGETLIRHMEGNISFVALPIPKGPNSDYLKKRVWRPSPLPRCTKNASVEERKYCWVANQIHRSGVTYSYYTPHTYSWERVLRVGEGNNYDLNMLIGRYASVAGLVRRWASGVINVGGTDIIHRWMELRVDGHFLCFDAVSHLTGRGCNNIFGFPRDSTVLSFFNGKFFNRNFFMVN